MYLSRTQLNESTYFEQLFKQIFTSMLQLNSGSYI